MSEPKTPPADGGTTPGRPVYQIIGLGLGPALCLAMLLSPAPLELSPLAWKTAAIASLMAVWWATEAIPVAITAILPLILFPLIGVTDVRSAAAPYAHPIIFLFMGGFILALAMQRWNLHRRIALNIILFVGTHPQAIVVGFMIATAFLSMWISNTATTMMMLPVALSVIGVLTNNPSLDPENGDSTARPTLDSNSRNFATALMLAIAYSANVGGMGTLIGTGPNALVAAFLSDHFDIDLGFVQWMAIGLPVIFLMLPIVWWVLTRVAYPFTVPESRKGATVIRDALTEMGPTSSAEKRLSSLFVVVAGLWILRPWLGIPGLNDTTIAMFGALMLFLIPAGSGGKGEALLKWERTTQLPWGVLILVGGGLSLAASVTDTGLAQWAGNEIMALELTHMLMLIVAIVTLIIFMTELTSNTATTAAMLPVVAAIATAGGVDPISLAAPAALAASCAFMLPVATPPNAIVFSTGLVSIPQMVRAGFIINLIGIVMLSGFAYLLLPFILGVTTGG
jgi:solute carrier family 13 (sodium-dependent dicarboxylate transporter), member 2/3/5